VAVIINSFVFARTAFLAENRTAFFFIVTPGFSPANTYWSRNALDGRDKQPGPDKLDML